MPYTCVLTDWADEQALRGAFKDKINAVPHDDATKALMLAESVRCFKMNNEVGDTISRSSVTALTETSFGCLSITRSCAASTAPADSSSAGYSSGSSCSGSSTPYVRSPPTDPSQSPSLSQCIRRIRLQAWAFFVRTK